MSFYDKIIDDVLEAAGSAYGEFEEAIRESTATDPSEEPMVWEREGRTRGVVTLDAPKVEAQFLAAWVSLRVVPAVLKSRLDILIERVEAFVGKKSGEKAAGRLGRKIAGFASLGLDVLHFFGEAAVEQAFEKAIRDKSLRLRRELLELRLGRDKPRRLATCRVYTRNTNTPKQRAKNTSWTDRKN